MDNMVSMQRPKPEAKEEVKQAPGIADAYYEKYPWGLRLTLNDEELSKLGIDLKTLSVDTEGSGEFKFCICRISQSEDNSMGDGKKKSRTLEIQITDLCLNCGDDFEGSFKEAVSEEE